MKKTDLMAILEVAEKLQDKFQVLEGINIKNMLIEADTDNYILLED